MDAAEDGESDALDALCDEGPWKRAGGGRRWEFIFLSVLLSLDVMAHHGR